MDIQKILEEQKRIAKEQGIKQSDRYVNQCIANKAVGELNFNNPIWRKNRKEGFLKVSQTEEYRKKRKELQKANIENPEYHKKVSNGVKKWLSTEEAQNARKQASNKRRLWILDVEKGILYENLKDIAKVYNVHHDTFRKHYIKAQPEKFRQLNYIEVEKWKLDNR